MQAHANGITSVNSYVEIIPGATNLKARKQDKNNSQRSSSGEDFIIVPERTNICQQGQTVSQCTTTYNFSGLGYVPTGSATSIHFGNTPANSYLVFINDDHNSGGDRTSKIGLIEFENEILGYWTHPTKTIAFPEVRLKKYLEVRGADGGPWSSVCALPAFWTGILYDSDVLDETWNLVSSWTDIGRQNFYDDVAKSGLQSKTPDNLDIKVFLKKLLQLSSKGLSKRAIFNEEKKNETIFLNTLSSILDSGESPAEVWKKLFLEKWEQNIDIIYKSNSF